MSARTGWQDILDANETILWQGRPDGAVSVKLKNIVMLVFGVFFTGFALFWMVLATGAGGVFWMFGLIHFSVGMGIVWGALFFDSFRRRHSWYTLTNRRAFIATNLPLQGRRLKSWPITADSVLELDEGALATVNFAQVTKRSKNGSYQVAVGFERIAEGREVYRMMRDIQAAGRQRGASQRPEQS